MRWAVLTLVMALTVSACGSGQGFTPTPTPTPRASQPLPADMKASVEEFVTRLRAGRPTCPLRAQKLLEAESGHTGAAALRACRRHKPTRDTGYPADAADKARLLSAGGGRVRISVPSDAGVKRFLLVREKGTWKVLGIGRATP
jgi:hypothetical protein